MGYDVCKLHYDKSPDVYLEHYRQEYAKVGPLINIFSSADRSFNKISELEQKLDEKETVIETLGQNGQQKASEVAKLRAKVESIENSRESLTLLLKKVFDLRNGLKNKRTSGHNHKMFLHTRFIYSGMVFELNIQLEPSAEL